jgi:hypothetical protein
MLRNLTMISSAPDDISLITSSMRLYGKQEAQSTTGTECS